jgi:uncharacterized membrane protein
MGVPDGGALVVAAPALKIDWANMPTYNTVMSLAAGTGLLLVVALGYQLRGGGRVVTQGYALAFGILGLILALTGLHMSLTWPLAAGGFPFDNVIFGEPSLIFGFLLLGAAFYLWKRGETLAEPGERVSVVAGVAGPISVFVFGSGLAAFGIAAAGIKYTLFAAPPQEPISGMFAAHPQVEATFMSLLYILVGIGAVLFPFALRKNAKGVQVVVGVAWGLAGIAFFLFGALNYFTHIGLIVNTM